MNCDNGERKILNLPEGFRKLTFEEQAKLDEISLKMTVLRERLARLDQIVRAAEAEIRLAKLERENIMRGIGQLEKAAADWNKAHGVLDVQKDRMIVGGAVYIRKREPKTLPDQNAGGRA